MQRLKETKQETKKKAKKERARTAEKLMERAGPFLWQGAALLAGFVLGGGSALGGVTPLGLALVIGCPPGHLLACTVGALAGGMVFLPTVTALRMAGAIMAAAGARLLIRKPYWPGAVAGAGTLLIIQLLLAIDRGSPAGEACLVLGTAGLALAIGRAFLTWSVQKSRGVCLWLAVLTVCAQNFAFGLFWPGAALLTAAGLVAACHGSVEQAAVAALAGAFALTAADSTLAFAGLACAAGVLCAAVMAPGERLGGGVWFWCGCILGGLAAGNMGQLAALLLSAGVGCLAFWLLPVQAAASLCPEKPLPVLQNSNSGAAGQLDRVADSLAEVGGMIEKIYSHLPPKGESYNWVVDYVAETLCQGCDVREDCWVKRYSSTMDGFQRLKPLLESGGCVVVEQLPGQFSLCIHQPQLCGTVTSGYELYRGRREARLRAGALRAAITEQYGAIAQALTQLSDQLGSTGYADPHKAVRVQKLFARLGLEPLECSVQTDMLGRMKASVTVARAALAQPELAALSDEIGHICHRSMGVPVVTSCRTVTTLTFGEKPVYCPLFGMASRPAGEVSGDCVDQFCDVFGKGHMILCDGMGTGKPAAVDGMLAAHLTGKLLRAGFAADAAARLVNVALSLKGASESSATLDLLSVDLYTGHATLFKAGAAPSFLVRDGQCRPIEGASLPVGILEKVVGRKRVFPLREGDILVLVSDGLLADGDGWLKEQLSLSAVTGKSPQQIADVLADTARRRAGILAHPDDVTVAVCLLQQNR